MIELKDECGYVHKPTGTLFVVEHAMQGTNFAGFQLMLSSWYNKAGVLKPIDGKLFHISYRSMEDLQVASYNKVNNLIAEKAVDDLISNNKEIFELPFHVKDSFIINESIKRLKVASRI